MRSIVARPHAAAAPHRPAAGALLSAGDRLSPDTIAKVGQALRAVIDAAGDDEEVRAAAAGATGAFARHCSPDDLRVALEAGPLAAGSGKLSERIGSAQVRILCVCANTHAGWRKWGVGAGMRWVPSSRMQASGAVGWRGARGRLQQRLEAGMSSGAGLGRFKA